MNAVRCLDCSGKFDTEEYDSCPHCTEEEVIEEADDESIIAPVDDESTVELEE